MKVEGGARMKFYLMSLKSITFTTYHIQLAQKNATKVLKVATLTLCSYNERSHLELDKYQQFDSNVLIQTLHCYPSQITYYIY